METKRQRQTAEVIKRHFSVVLQQEGGYIFGHQALVTVTNVKMTPDMSMAKIYLSIYNTEDKQSIILLMNDSHHRLKTSLYHRIRKHVRRMPAINFYIDETLDEMFRIQSLFGKLEEENQMGRRDEEE